jgi:hypothetical protein
MSYTFNLISHRSTSLDSFLNKETCNECETNEITCQCDKCGNGVCKHNNCQWSFPYKFNTTMILCKRCFNDIDKKLINYDHLIIYRFLKKNVSRRRISCD